MLRRYHKEIIFTPRIIAFKKSFIAVWNNIGLKPYAFIWYEGVTSRKKGDINLLFIVIFYNFVIHKKSFDGQLLSSAQKLDPSSVFEFKNIRNKIFRVWTPTSFHHQVEVFLKKKKKCTTLMISRNDLKMQARKSVLRKWKLKILDSGWIQFTVKIK